MDDNLKLDTLRYFLECYFNVSADYAELEELIAEFKIIEKDALTKQLIAEVSIIQQNKVYLRGFIKKYGMRNMNNQRLEWFISSLINGLEK